MENRKPLCYEVTYSGYGYFTDIICDYLPLLFAYKIMFHPRQAKIVFFYHSFYWLRSNHKDFGAM